ncbi:MAG: FtsX-like permease family protein [Candidatus Sumerlaeota bacterium]|nr:FtsX-like permease family protein [Candidatus Sumerlaeota bacterium]
MSIWRLVIKEILHRKLGFLLGAVSVVVAVGCLVGAVTLLKVHDIRTQQILANKEAETKARMAALEDEMRKAMLNLGFNIVILPKDQNLSDWHTEDYASKYMPEEYVDKLAKSNIITVQHLLPSLQQKVKWPEQKRTIILVGTRGEVPFTEKKAMKPMVQPVPPGTIVLGYELQQDLGFKVGDKLKLMEREFTVHQCYPQRGTKDDVTAWINLAEAQEMLNKKGQINAILALECGCGWARPDMVRAEIAKILPDTQIIEKSSEALARAEARTKVGDEAKASIEFEAMNRQRLRSERERLAAILVPLAMAVCVVWIAILAFGNVRERRMEIGILRAIGLRSRQILAIFLSKAIAMGIVGGIIGILAGFAVGRYMGIQLEKTGAGVPSAQSLFDGRLALMALLLAPFLSAIASWIPTVLAAREDPAVILREE